MSTVLGIDRRTFLKTSTGLVVGMYIVPKVARFAAAAPAAKLPDANAFLRVAPDESVTILLAHSEMGQGIWTALPILFLPRGPLPSRRRWVGTLSCVSTNAPPTRRSTNMCAAPRS